MPYRAAILCFACIAIATPAFASDADVSITGAGQQQEANCAAGANALITGVSHVITLTGPCEKVVIAGMGHRVKIENAREVMIDGAQSDVALASPARTIGVFGDGQKLDAALEGDNAALEVGGHGHKVRIALRSASRINVHGIQNEVMWRQENGAPPPRLTMEGHAHKVAGAK